MNAALTFLTVLLTASSGIAGDFLVADFGATGDGRTDDGPAIRKAVDAAVAAGAGSRVVFEPKTYRLDWCQTASHQISLTGAKDIAMEGNGALLVNHPRNNLISLKNCSGVTVRGFTVDYDPLPFTQGTITGVNAKEGWLDFRIQNGYRHPVEEYGSPGLTKPRRDWGVVFDPVGRHRRWDVNMHFFMKEFARSPAGSDIARVFFVDEAGKDLANVRPGDRYVITFKYGNSGANNELSGCNDCRFEDFTVHMAKYGMTFAVVKSPGQNVFRRVRMTFKPGSDRLIVTPKDGFHCKENRVGPLIEECLFEGLLDDSINIGACPYWIKKVIAPGVYAMNGSPAAGDRLTAFTPSRSELVEGFVVKSVKPCAARPKWSEVELDREVPDPGVNDTGDDFPGGPEKLKFTGMYNLDACGAGYVVRNCTFREQRRHAMLVRAPGGLIEGNTIDGVGGSGVYMANEIGSFYEGPVPRDCIIRDNVFRNTQGVPIVVGSVRASNPDAYAQNIRILGNQIEGLATSCIRAFRVSGLTISGNTWTHNPAVATASVAPLLLTNVVNETISANSDAAGEAPLGTKPPRIRVDAANQGFADADGRRFTPCGVSYYRPGTGWAPQLWKQFDAEATRQDFLRMKRMGLNVARVFVSFGSFYTQPGQLDPAGLAAFDRMLDLADEAGLYLHPTGPDHWEGMPPWTQDLGDIRSNFAHEAGLQALEDFWRMFAGRYRGRSTIWAYDLRNEPALAWDTPESRAKWEAWRTARQQPVLPAPSKDSPPSEVLADYQRFRESLAEAWVARQTRAIRAADPEALVTAGLLQWTVPAQRITVDQYTGFRPEIIARHLDFLSLHYYPLARGVYRYEGPDVEDANLAVLECMTRECAKPGKPVVIAEFGWYGGGPLEPGGKPADEEQQARWCRRLVEVTAPMACGWINWGLYDTPEAGDVSRHTGLITSTGADKAWGRTFAPLVRGLPPGQALPARPDLPWESCTMDGEAMSRFQTEYLLAFQKRIPPPPPDDRGSAEGLPAAAGPQPADAAEKPR
jgi:hypothetical protein